MKKIKPVKPIAELPKDKPVKTVNEVKLAPAKRRFPFAIILIVINCLILTATLAFLYLLPLKAKTIQTLASQLLAQQISQQNSQKTMFDLENVNPEVEIINASLPNAETIVSFIELTNKLEEQAALKLFTFDADLPVMDAGRNAFFPLTIAMEGSLDQIKAALDVLQTSPYLFKINRLSLVSANLATGEIQAMLNLAVYVDINFESSHE
ncbi:hypothetical protein KJ965_00550 [Patescibacteria group bacterium]|nr:hypothetical protein [Patescibacteria group bacterium]